MSRVTGRCLEWPARSSLRQICVASHCCCCCHGLWASLSGFKRCSILLADLDADCREDEQVMTVPTSYCSCRCLSRFTIGHDIVLLVLSVYHHPFIRGRLFAPSSWDSWLSKVQQLSLKVVVSLFWDDREDCLSCSAARLLCFSATFLYYQFQSWSQRGSRFWSRLS